MREIHLASSMSGCDANLVAYGNTHHLVLDVCYPLSNCTRGWGHQPATRSTILLIVSKLLPEILMRESRKKDRVATTSPVITVASHPAGARARPAGGGGGRGGRGGPRGHS